MYWLRALWKRIRTYAKEVASDKQISLYAAGIAYYGVLAFFPLIAIIVAVTGLVLSPHQMNDAAVRIGQYLPHDVAAMILSQLKTAVARRADSVLLLIIGTVVALWGASGAMRSMMTALNYSYGVKETRSWIRQQLAGLSLTVGTIGGVLILGAIFVSGGGWLHDFYVPYEVTKIVLWTRWPLMICSALVGLSVLYQVGPDRSRIRWQWISRGAIVAAIAWMIVSVLFFVYLQYFGNYVRNYSVYAGIIGLMVWLNYSAYAVLIGAKVNHSLEVSGA